MEKYEMLRNLKINDIGDFSLNNKSAVGKVVQIYSSNTFKIIFALNKVIFKFNCKLFNTKLKDNDNIKPILPIICDITDLAFDKKDISNLLLDNTKLLKIYCHNFDKEGYLLVDFFNLDDNKSINEQLIDNDLIDSDVSKDTFSFIKL
tara:strand:- start:584 stop:1027 length:444 start_codon:yes stop_codon:yes gene_type:complete